MATKTYPTDAGVSFLLCDGVRQELFGKATLIGVYIGGDVRIQSDKEVALLQLYCFWVFEDGEGAFKWSMRLQSPSGGEVVKSPPQDTAKMPNLNMTIAVGFAAEFKEEGEYTVILNLDDHTYMRRFRLTRGELVAA